jgi:predicted phosphodiesterase
METQIKQLALHRDPVSKKWLYGRKEIMNRVPGTTEWQVRKTIKEVRGDGSGAFPAPTPEQRQSLAVAEERVKLPSIVVKVPKRKIHKIPKLNTEQIVIGGDFHAPYEHKPSCDLFYQVIEDLQPSKVVLIGDVINLDEFSKYDKIPGIPTWLEDVKAASDILGNIRASAPNTDLVWIKGNHEDRLKKHLIRHDSILYDALNMEKLFILAGVSGDALKQWRYQDESEVFDEELGLVYAHGHYVRKHSGMTAFAHVEALLLSVIVGHSHRLGLYRRSSGRSRFKNEQPLFGIDNGCLCRFDIPYIDGKTTNWQHGFSVLSVDRSDDVPLIEPAIVEINDGKTIFRGKTYKA